MIFNPAYYLALTINVGNVGTNVGDVGNKVKNVGINVGIVSEIQKKTENFFSVLGMAGVLGFEPRKCQIQSLMPYRLAIPQCAYL